MKILVALKQVPDTETKIKVAADGRSLDPADVKWITSPYDEYAIEEALRLKEAKGAEVTAVSVGEDKAKDMLRSALALGVDAAVLLRSGSTGDPLAVARTLAAPHGRVVVGVPGSAHQVNREVDRIAWIREKWGTSSEDGESAHIAGCAALLGVPVTALRVIDGSEADAATMALEFLEAVK